MMSEKTRVDLEKLPTPRQVEVLRQFHALTQKLGRAPTVREVSQALGLESQGAHDTVLELERKGLLRFAKVTRRGPGEITRVGKRWL